MAPTAPFPFHTPVMIAHINSYFPFHPYVLIPTCELSFSHNHLRPRIHARSDVHKYLVTQKSANAITGPILVTTSVRQTCPTSCALKNSRCYAETGYLGHFIWPALNRAALGSTFANNIAVRSLSELLGLIRSLPERSVWRHNQAGDLMWEIEQGKRLSRQPPCTFSLRPIKDAEVLPSRTTTSFQTAPTAPLSKTRTSRGSLSTSAPTA